jgi:hypothetical protein
VHLRHPTLSPSIGTDKAATSSGTVKKIDAVVVSGR